ncbi:MAG TPA: hypothetical protein VFQ35_08900, partial [Polyangiaceae bacterium]|nr:hypothetical protein [Polyangiaceae bacterium]
MPLGPSCPQWVALDECLAKLVRRCRARFAAVIDAGKCVWCSSPDLDIHLQFAAADRFYKVEIKPREGSLRRGAHVVLENLDGPDFYVGESFAAIYFLVIWFARPRSLDSVREHLRAALP